MIVGEGRGIRICRGWTQEGAQQRPLRGSGLAWSSRAVPGGLKWPDLHRPSSGPTPSLPHEAPR